MKKLLILFFVCILTLSSVSAVSAQCAMCRATVESNSKNSNKAIGKGLNLGILYLMTIPYIAVGVVGFLWYRNTRKNSKGKLGFRRNITPATEV
jgi:hypothetical protein